MNYSYIEKSIELTCKRTIPFCIIKSSFFTIVDWLLSSPELLNEVGLVWADFVTWVRSILLLILIKQQTWTLNMIHFLCYIIPILLLLLL